MHEDRTSSSVYLAASHPFPKFQLLVIYDELSSGRSAAALVGPLEGATSSELPVETRWWKFALLRDAQYFHEALQDALAADMIVVAVRGGGQLPFPGRRWIDEWVSQKTNLPSALVAVIEDHPGYGGQGEELIHYLEHQAEIAKMDFFCRREGPGPAQIIPDEPQRAGVIPGPSGISHWGINE